MPKRTNKEMNIGLVPMTLILSAITLFFILLVTRMSNPSGNQITSSNVIPGEGPIRNTADLDAVSKKLDQNDPGVLDQGITNLTVDASSF